MTTDLTSPHVIHDPQAHLDYFWDWEPWLVDNEVITASSVSFYPAGEMVLDSHTATLSTVTAWVSGGRLGREYRLTAHIVTNMGREDDRSFWLTCENR